MVVQLVVTIVSIAFLIVVAAAVSYFAFAGPSRDLTAVSDSEDTSTAD